MSKKILVIGSEERVTAFKHCFVNAPEFEIELSDGDEEEDFELYDLIADLNFDDDDENIEIYAGLKDKLILLSSVKQSLSEFVYKSDAKLKSKLFGINAIPAYLSSNTWEISAFRYPEYEAIEIFLQGSQATLHKVADRVGMFRPRIDFVLFNELASCLQEQISLQPEQGNELIEKYSNQIDTFGVTDVFETLMAMYEDTKLVKYCPCPFLKTKYLRDQTFLKKQKL